MKRYDDPILQAVLDFCNEQRELDGRPTLAEIPAGKREDPASCPCGEGAGRYVLNETFVPTAADENFPLRHKPLPRDVRTFVERFDNGEYPQFDIDEGSVLSG